MSTQRQSYPILPSLLLLLVSALPVLSRPLFRRDDDEELVIIKDGILCEKPSWPEIVLFLGTNYFAHALSVRSAPGATTKQNVLSVIYGTLFPYCGTLTALGDIFDMPVLGKTDLEKAVRAGAVWTLCRNYDWAPNPGETLKIKGRVERSCKCEEEDCDSCSARKGCECVKCVEEKQRQGTPLGDGEVRLAGPDSRSLGEKKGATQEEMPVESSGISTTTTDPSEPRICALLSMGTLSSNAVRYKPLPITDPRAQAYEFHGSYYFPHGYSLVPVSNEAIIEPISSVDPNALPEGVDFTPTMKLAYNEGLIVYIASLVQILSGCWSLYRARGEQFETFGYAAFSLTIVPYVLCSLVNLIANCVNYEFPVCYIVWNEVWEEARARNPGTHADGMIGRIVEEDQERVPLREITVTMTEKKEILYTLDCEEEEGYKFERVKRPFTMSDHKRYDLVMAEAATKDLKHADKVWIPPIMPKYKLRPTRWIDKHYFSAKTTCYILCLAVPYIVMAALTRFDPKQSTLSQRAWVISWLAVGQSCSDDLVVAIRRHAALREKRKSAVVKKTVSKFRRKMGDWAWIFLMPAIFAVPAIGGLVVVVQQILQVGLCEDLQAIPFKK